MRNELKVEISNNQVLEDIIQKSYFNSGQMGRLVGKNNFIQLTPEVDETAYVILKGLHNATIKVTNSYLIDGSFRFIIEDINEVIKLTPISIFCIKDENQKYSFY
jgi:hypothetical protein